MPVLDNSRCVTWVYCLCHLQRLVVHHQRLVIIIITRYIMNTVKVLLFCLYFCSSVGVVTGMRAGSIPVLQLWGPIIPLPEVLLAVVGWSVPESELYLPLVPRSCVEL